MCTAAKIFREPFNAISHMTGAAASIAGLTLLVVFSCLKAGAWHIVSFSIFGGTLVLMYASSSLYHGLNLSEKGLTLMRKLDHIMIFMVIAGSYTPICLVALRGAWGWSIFGTVWGIAVTGIFLKIFFMNAPRWISTLIYLVMGWICIVAIYPIIKALDPGALAWLASGGVCYTAGAVIYALKSPDPFPEFLGFHGIWHLLVMCGSFCHFWMAFKYLMYQ